MKDAGKRLFFGSIMKRPYVEIERLSDPRVSDEQIRELVDVLFEDLDPSATGLLSIVMVNDDRSRQINRSYLNHDYATDVLAFLYDDEEDAVWGEMIINVEKAAEQSEEYGVSFENELARLMIHGLLHLIGFDDIEHEAQKRMITEEDRLVQKYSHLLSPGTKEQAILT